MRITVGGIIFNGEDSLPDSMLEAWLKQIYDIGDEIIIVEGATKATHNHYFDGNTSWATTNGKSTDRTVEIIKNFSDPEEKIILVEADGFWNGKTAMTNVWCKYATGDYLWMISSDEFYKKRDVKKIINLLEEEKPDQIDFFANHFWGDYKNCIDENTGKNWGNGIPWERIWKHYPGSRWERHEPPIYVHPDGIRTTQKNVISRERTLEMGIKMFHYSFVDKKQIDFKTKFYGTDYQTLWSDWKKDKKTPLICGAYTVPYKNSHPIYVRSIIKKA
jgi:hypothetical protein